MKIVVAGGTGFLGRPLAEALSRSGCEVVVLSRDGGVAGPARTVRWAPDGSAGAWASEIDGCGAVVNLAGEPIAGKRWTEAQKDRIRTSRILATRSLVEAINGATRPPSVFVSGSAVGYYGALGDEIAAEEHRAGRDFLAGVCVDWEAEARRAAASATRTVLVRTGLVLERDGGALPQMLPPFRFGVGGPVGSGRQYWPWIHRADWIAMVQWAVATPAVDGALNATAPAPETNAAFARALGRAMHRPALMPAPAFALRIALGEMADALLLTGQRAVPAKAERLGFAFKYRDLPAALASLF